MISESLSGDQFFSFTALENLPVSISIFLWHCYCLVTQFLRPTRLSSANVVICPRNVAETESSSFSIRSQLRLGMVSVTILGRMKISGFLNDFLVRPQQKLGTARKCWFLAQAQCTIHFRLSGGYQQAELILSASPWCRKACTYYSHSAFVLNVYILPFSLTLFLRLARSDHIRIWERCTSFISTYRAANPIAPNDRMH